MDACDRPIGQLDSPALQLQSGPGFMQIGHRHLMWRSERVLLRARPAQRLIHQNEAPR